MAVLTGCSESTGIHRIHESSNTSTRSQSLAIAPRKAGAGEYMVMRGDSLYSIAFRNQIDFHDLAEWNQIPGPAYTIYPGRILRLTAPGSARPLPSATTTASSARTKIESPQTGGGRAPVASAAVTRPSVIAVLPPDSATPPLVIPPATGLGPGFDTHYWEWPTRGAITHGFGLDGNKGVDIAGNFGQIVLAAAPGKVVYSGSALQGYGELIIIKHDEQYLSAYGFNRRRLVNEGELVSTGQPIAELGNGPEQKPELHFEIRYKGRPLNPQSLLPAR